MLGGADVISDLYRFFYIALKISDLYKNFQIALKFSDLYRFFEIALKNRPRLEARAVVGLVKIPISNINKEFRIPN